jgi:hypothetical protein
VSGSVVGTSACRLGAQTGVWVVPSDTKVCPFCAERIEAAAIRCRYCGSALPSSSEPPPGEPQGDKEVLGRDPKGSRSLMTAGGILLVLLIAYGAFLVVSSLQPQHHRPEGNSGAFNIFVKVENACEEDDGTLVTTDPHGNPMAFATPDGPERFWCVSRQYLTSIGRRHQDPPPPVPKVPGEFKWQWPSTTFGE